MSLSSKRLQDLFRSRRLTGSLESHSPSPPPDPPHGHSAALRSDSRGIRTEGLIRAIDNLTKAIEAKQRKDAE